MKGAWKQSGVAAMPFADLGYLGTFGGGGRARRAKLCIYVFAFAFAAFTVYLSLASALPTPSSPSAAWFGGLLASATPYRSQIANFFSSIFPTNSSFPSPGPRGRGGLAANGGRVRTVVGSNRSSAVGSNKQLGSGGGVANSSAGRGIGVPVLGGDSASVNASTAAKSGATTNNSAGGLVGAAKSGGRGVIMGNGSAGNGSAAKADTRIVVGPNNPTGSGSGASSNNSVSAVPIINQTRIAVAAIKNGSGVASHGNGAPGNDQTAVVSPAVNNQNQTGSGASSSGSGGAVNKQKETTTSTQGSASSAKDRSVQGITAKAGNSAVLVLGNGSLAKEAVNANGDMKIDWIKMMASCDMFHGKWVRDDSYPLYPEGSCPHIDESFNCYLNGRPDQAYQKLRWQPNGCNIPRLNPADMLERLRGKRLVFVGDSLNRNMWESLVCILRNSIKDKTKVFEVSGRHKFRTEGSYSFLFMDYNCSVEFFRAPFLVQESEMTVSNGKTKETLRLDVIHQLSFKYKDADIIIFNTGHWWTHEKTSLGKDYYQEGNHVYSELNVDDAFRKALSTWAKWIDANVNPKKTALYFRGYSASHFSGGQWNSGGSCDKETEPITNEQYLLSYPPKMSILENVIHGMKRPVVYLNITRMTDYRKDAHPSVFRKQKLTEEERRSPELYQDCSHWCLPGVPDSWNELLYAQILIRQHRMLH